MPDRYDKPSEDAEADLLAWAHSHRDREIALAAYEGRAEFGTFRPIQDHYTRMEEERDPNEAFHDRYPGVGDD
jgi:hypothetical protein